jgi:hypothetical protein
MRLVRLLFAAVVVLDSSSNGSAEAFFVPSAARSVPQERAGVVAAAAAAAAAAWQAATSARSSSSFTRLLMSAGTTPAPALNVQTGAGKILRAARLTDVNGNKIQLGDKMAAATSSNNNKNTPVVSVVIFLRHLGWPYCWSYAKEWCDELQKQQQQPLEQLENIITAVGDDGDEQLRFGLYFISIGDETKLQKFLELNPNIPPSIVFVDGYDFEAYKAVGFGSLDDIAVVGGIDKKDIKMKAPNLGGGIVKWWQYLTNVMELSPVEKGKTGIPEGVKRLGGTIVVSGDDIVYKFSDRIPGDTPNVDNVMTIVKKQYSTQKL